ncbi:MAG: glycosyltransferase family 4 protein [Flavobacteriales bacterium]|jgi:glycosyltransferase involved in cell wall biosynthesis
MRVAYITHYSDLYGANRSLLDLMTGLRDRHGVEPLVLAPGPGALVNELERLDIPCHMAPFQPWMTERWYGGGPHHRLLQYLREEKAARERHKANQALLPGIEDWLRSNQVTLLHANSAVAVMGPLLRSRTGLPLVWHIRELPEIQYGLHIDRGRRAYANALRQATRVIAISSTVKEDIHRYAPDLPLDVIYNGVVPGSLFPELKARSQERWSSGIFSFAMLGVIHPAKGQLEAVDAFRIVLDRGLDARLIIAGSGREAPVRERIAALGLQDRVEMTGYVKDPYSVLLRAHALLMCSPNEAMGRVTVEAMASGIPVVGLDAAGTSEIVTHRRNGLLYNGGCEALAQRMIELASDRDLARTMGRSAQDDTVARFSIERYCDEVAAVYQHLGAQEGADRQQGC